MWSSTADLEDLKRFNFRKLPILLHRNLLRLVHQWLVESMAHHKYYFEDWLQFHMLVALEKKVQYSCVQPRHWGIDNNYRMDHWKKHIPNSSSIRRKTKQVNVWGLLFRFVNKFHFFAVSKLIFYDWMGGYSKTVLNFCIRMGQMFDLANQFCWRRKCRHYILDGEESSI